MKGLWINTHMIINKQHVALECMYNIHQNRQFVSGSGILVRFTGNSETSNQECSAETQVSHTWVCDKE